MEESPPLPSLIILNLVISLKICYNNFSEVVILYFTVTAKLRILPNDTQKQLLLETMRAYVAGCNHVSAYIYRTHDLSQASINKALYQELRINFGLRSQMAQSVMKTVIARCKTILTNQEEWIQPVFKHPDYDLVWNRDYSLASDLFSVNTLVGRIKVLFHDNAISSKVFQTITSNIDLPFTSIHSAFRALLAFLRKSNVIKYPLSVRLLSRYAQS